VLLHINNGNFDCIVIRSHCEQGEKDIALEKIELVDEKLRDKIVVVSVFVLCFSEIKPFQEVGVTRFGTTHSVSYYIEKLIKGW